MANAHEYGFYSNVNPQVDHPRWSQATERRLGWASSSSDLKKNADVQRLRRLPFFYGALVALLLGYRVVVAIRKHMSGGIPAASR
jgi:hypothetical protein